MASTKITPILPADVERDIAAATEARDALVARIAAGETVAPGALGDAEDALRMARLRTDLAARNAAESAERERVAERDRVLAGLTSTDADGSARQAGELVALHAEAVEVLTRLAGACERFERSKRDAWARLRTLGEMPAGVTIERRVPLAQLRVDGVAWLADYDLTAVLVADAAQRAVDATPTERPGRRGRQALRDAATVNGRLVALDHVERCGRVRSPLNDDGERPRGEERSDPRP